ncbi:MAG: PAS domain S-box protein [Desulfotomaculaceae bacterium]|nr:PAS domain S-box protein [Desulfotomaculaceae bacterium]
MKDMATTKNKLVFKTPTLDIQEHLQFLANVVEHNAQPFAVGYSDGRIITCNSSFSELLGYTKEELSAMTWDIELTPPEWREYSGKMLEELCRTGCPQRYEKEYIRKDGSRVPLELFVHKVSDFKGNIRYYSFYTDITRRKQIDAELRKQREDLEELIKERTNKLRATNAQLLSEIAERKRAEEVLQKHSLFLQQLIDTIPHSIFYKDTNGIYQGCNKAFEVYLGLTKKKIIGKCVYDVSPKDLADKYHEMDLLLLSEPGVKVYESAAPHVNGTRDEVVFSKATYSNPAGTVAGIVGVMVDITERKHAEEALRESENRYRTIFENTGTATVIYGEDTIIHLVNTEAEKLFGYSREEMEGKKSLTAFVAKEDLELIKEYYRMRRIAPEAVPRKYEFRFIDKHGSLKDILMTVAIIPGTKDCVASLLDITERKQLQNEMFRLERLNLVGEMAAGIGHEIRNPMTTVRGFLQILRNKRDCAQYKEYLNLMIEELDRANSIIKEYLSMAKNKAIELRLQNLNNILEALFPLIQADAMVSDKYIKLELGDIPDLLLDEEETRQLILNLVRNGLEAMSPGGNLTIKTFIDGEEVVIAVQDQGKGIEPDVLEKIGTPFFTTKNQGTGLGLAICYSITARHNASIKVDTGPTGTTFSVRFGTNHNKHTGTV